MSDSLLSKGRYLLLGHCCSRLPIPVLAGEHTERRAADLGLKLVLQRRKNTHRSSSELVQKHHFIKLLKVDYSSLSQWKGMFLKLSWWKAKTSTTFGVEYCIVWTFIWVVPTGKEFGLNETCGLFQLYFMIQWFKGVFSLFL